MVRLHDPTIARAEPGQLRGWTSRSEELAEPRIAGRLVESSWLRRILAIRSVEPGDCQPRSTQNRYGDGRLWMMPTS